MTDRSGWRVLFLLVGATLSALALLAVPRRAAAKDCGGGVACACGDRVVADVVLDGDLNNCLDNGLTLAGGVLDCGGNQIAGPGDVSTAVGVLVTGFDGTGAVGATIQNCRIRNFYHGIEIEGGSGIVLGNNVIFSNMVGVWMGGGATGSRLDGNSVRDNRDEGVHVGGDTTSTLVVRNSFVNNENENLYLIRTTANTVQDNTFENSNSAAIHVKDASNNVFTDNILYDHDVHVRGDSSGNRFENTELVAGFIHFSANQENGVWGYPHDNHVTDGKIRKASTCFEFDGAYANTVDGTAIDTCRVVEEKEAGDLTPHDNVVNVVKIDPTDHTTSGRHRSGNLRMARAAQDPDHFSFEVSTFVPKTPIDPLNEALSCTLSDFGGAILSFTMPPGTLTARGRSFVLIDPQGTFGGVRRLNLRPLAQGTWRLQLSGLAPLDGANYPLMTFSCSVGDDSFAYTDFWRQSPNGWKLRLR